jgi:hypothetical protein
MALEFILHANSVLLLGIHESSSSAIINVNYFFGKMYGYELGQYFAFEKKSPGCKFCLKKRIFVGKEDVWQPCIKIQSSL